MHSVSIVYRKDRRESLGQLKTQHSYKRSVDEYYTKLMEKEKHLQRINSQKKEILDRIKLKTSSNHRKTDKFNILQTLNISPIALHQPQPTQEKREEIKALQKLYVSRKLELSRPTLKGISFAPLSLNFEQQQTFQSKLHSRLKCLFKSKPTPQPQDTVIAISVNFILDEHYFWAEESVDEVVFRIWRKLQDYASIVWVCRKEESLKKLARYSKTYDLRLDGVYLIVPRKNRNMLTVAYSSIQSDFGIKFHKSNSPLVSREEKKLIVINGLPIESINNLSYSSFYYSVPIIKNFRSIVHYTRIDLNDRTRFGAVMKILSQESRPQPYDLLKILLEYERKEEFGQSEALVYDSDQFLTPSAELLLKIEQIKREFTKYFSQSLSVNLNQKISYQNSENSGLFLIGDILRRNYKIYQQYHKYFNRYRGYQERRLGGGDQPRRRVLGAASYKFRKYRNEVYVWEF